MSLADWAKDPERTNYNADKTTLTLDLGKPRIDRKYGRTWLTWHQSDGSRVTLVWFDGTRNLIMKHKSLPED